MDKHDFYIEWWPIGDKIKTPEPNTFSIRYCSLRYFLKRFINGPEKRSIVYLRDVTTNKVIVDKKSTC